MTYLDSIVAQHRALSEADPRSREELWGHALAAPMPADARASLTRPGVSVIAEIKRRSPSRGDLAPDLDVASLATAYAEAGVGAISVLTDEEFFGGSLDDLRVAHEAVATPLLRKDFIVDRRQLADARIAGASLALLIVAALDDQELADLIVASRDLGLLAVVEIHDEEEIDRAVAAGAQCIGVNQRNLHSFEVDTQLAATLLDRLPTDVLKIAESGIKSPEDVLGCRGYDAALIGEAFVTAPDPGAAVRSLVEAGASCS